MNAESVVAQALPDGLGTDIAIAGCRDDAFAVGTLPTSTDVVIIGGGIIGAAAAYELAGRGRSVVLLEKGCIGGEQSGRNWGWVRQQARDLDELPLMIEANRMWRGLERELEADIEWAAAGNLAVATDPARIAFFREWLGHAQAAGLDSRFVEPDEILSMVPGLEGPFLGAMFTPGDGHAEPGKATLAYAHAARRRGAVIAVGVAADRIVVDDSRVVGVETERGHIAAPVVVCAAGVWARQLLGRAGVDLPVRIVRTTVAATKPVARLTDIAVGYHPHVSFRQRRDGTLYIAAGGWSDYDITLASLDHLRMFLPNYLKNRRMIRLHIGRPLIEDLVARLDPRRRRDRPWRRQRVLDPPASQQKVRSSLEHFRRLVPAVEPEVVKTWAGYTDTTPDAIPVIDRPGSPAGLVIATAFSGHGFGMGPIVGRLVAELASEEPPSMNLRAFRLGRFKDGTFKKPRLVS